MEAMPPTLPPTRNTFGLSRRSFVLFLLAATPACLCAAWFFVHLAEQRIATSMAATARSRLTLYAAMLDSALNRYSYLPHVLATHPAVKRLVAEGDNTDVVNRYLEDLNEASGSMALFILDRKGVAVATSNWNNNESFFGHDYNYRPYFQHALHSGTGGYFGVGATTGKPGFFFTRRITSADMILGVAVTKVDLALLQREWRSGGETVFITDAHGVIFLSSRDDWRYRATLPLSEEAEKAMLYQRQFGNTLPKPIAIDMAQESGVDTVEIEGSRWLYTKQHLNDYGWSIWFLTPASLLEQQTKPMWFIYGGGVFMLLLLVLLARTSFAWTSAKRAAREAENIRAINKRLAEEIFIRKQTERELLSAQDDLLHASRMAALGQVATSVAHELSQPVTSMRMFAASCRRLAEEGQHEKVGQTIGHMLTLVDRINALIGQLKHFSRKAPGKQTRVSLNTAIRNALTVLQFKVEASECAPTVVCPEEAVVIADALQVEQVIINLVHNALDAASSRKASKQAPLVDIAVHVGEETVTLSVADNGPGIDPAIREQIFTPFFTTKRSGEGIGLGLAIVDNIVRAMHGEIAVTATASQGTCFALRLPLAPGREKMP